MDQQRTWVPQAWARRGTCHPWKMYKARFASFTTFWFAQKVPKSRHVSRLKIYLNCDCGRGSGPDPTGGANCAPSGPLDVLKRFAKGRVDRARGNGRRRMESQGKGGRGKGGGRLCPLLQEFLRAPITPKALRSRINGF